jgi:hypothetical protein
MSNPAGNHLRGVGRKPSPNGDAYAGDHAHNLGDPPPPVARLLAADQPAPAPELWAPPVPIGRSGAVPPFPARLLPGWLRDWVLGEAEATQTPPDLAGNLTLAIAGAALARRVRVRIRGNWTEPANLFTTIALPPGERKSAVFSDATAPVLEHERAEQESAATGIAELASEHRVMESRLKAIEAQAAKEDDKAEANRLRQQAKLLAKELAEHQVPDPPQFWCDDVTPEALARLIARQGGRVLLASAEGTCFEIAKGRYSETANFDVFLKGHAGDELRVNRTGRELDVVSQPALSCALAVQPEVISGLSEQSSMRGRGFLARWLYSLPASKVGHRKVAAAAVPAQVVEDYRQGMLWLWRLDASPVPGQEAGRELVFSPQADEALRELESWLEPQLADGEPLSFLAGWANKLAGAVARLSLILHMAGTLGTGRAWASPISRETVEAAVALGKDYYLPHARAAFGLMGADERSKDAARVVGWLATKAETLKVWKGVRVVSRSELHVGVFGGSRSVDDVSAICRLLCDHGYLRSIGPAYRRDSQVYEVNPYPVGDDEQV